MNGKWQGSIPPHNMSLFALSPWSQGSAPGKSAIDVAATCLPGGRFEMSSSIACSISQHVSYHVLSRKLHMGKPKRQLKHLKPTCQPSKRPCVHFLGGNPWLDPVDPCWSSIPSCSPPCAFSSQPWSVVSQISGEKCLQRMPMRLDLKRSKTRISSRKGPGMFICSTRCSRHARSIAPSIWNPWLSS